MRLLGIQRLRESDYADMREQVEQAIYQIVFEPAVKLIRAVDPATAKVIQVLNAPASPLERALRSGRVQYVGGVFSGEFNAQVAVEIRRLGGRFDKRMRVYFIDKTAVPEWVKAASTAFYSQAKGLHEDIKHTLDKVERDLDRLVLQPRIDAMKTIDRIQEGFRSAAEAVSVSPKITTESKEKLAKEYSDNMRLYIQDFSKSAIQSLRDVIEDNATKGYRFDRLTEMIRQRYGVTKSKAEFLARQETSLFMSKYRKMRFKEGGVERYRWATSHDEKVRKRHAQLDGRIFFYDQPPITDQSTGRTNNPGEDFNCRCVDIPVIERIDEARRAA